MYPDASLRSQQDLRITQAALTKRGYVVQSGQDAYGHRTLELHHLGIGTTPPELMRELGLGRGTLHMLTHPAMTLGQYLHQAKRGLDQTQRGLGHVGKYIWDPARANGVTYITAEGFLITAGFGNKHGSIFEPKNALQSLSGILNFTQSIIYALFARGNDEIALSTIKEKIDGVQNGRVDFSRIRYDPAQDAPKPGIGHAMMRTIRQYPIQIGAMFNMVGMSTYLGHAILERRSWQRILANEAHNEQGLKYLKAFPFEVGSTIASVTAWAMLLLKPKHHEEGQEASGSKLHQWWNKLCENPQAVTGALTLTSSSQRLIAGTAKGNKLQRIGESVYLPGDILLFFTKNDDYGSDNIKDIEGITEKITDYVNSLPVVMGPQTQRSTVESIAQYLADRRMETLRRENKLTPQLQTKVIARREQLVEAAMAKVVPEHNARLVRVSDAAERIVQRFPADVQPELQAHLATVMTHMPWLQATPQELQHVMESFSTHVRPNTSRQVQMKDIAQDITALLENAPEVNRTPSAAVLYDAFAPYLQPRSANDNRQAANNNIPQSMVTGAAHLERIAPLADKNVVIV